MRHHCVLVLHREDQSLFEMLEPFSTKHKVEPRRICTYQEALKTIKENCNPFPEDTDEDIFKWYLTVFPHFVLKDGWLCCTENPNAKWSEWEIGGKYADILPNSDGFCNSDKISNIEWTHSLSADETEELYGWWVHCCALKDKNDEAKINYDTYKTFDNLLKCMETTYFNEVLTPDGAWHDWDSIGYDEVSWAKDFYKLFIKDRDSDTVATVVDCTY